MASAVDSSQARARATEPMGVAAPTAALAGTGMAARSMNSIWRSPSHASPLDSAACRTVAT